MVFWVGVLSFGVGVLVGITFADAWKLLFPERKFPMPFSSRSHRLFSIGLILTLVLNMMVGLLLIVTRTSANDYYACMADWSQKFSQGYKARYNAAVAEDKATRESWNGLDEVVDSIQPGSQVNFQDQLQKFRELRAQQRAEEAKRTAIAQKNPLPDLPEEQCGDPEGIRR